MWSLRDSNSQPDKHSYKQTNAQNKFYYINISI